MRSFALFERTCVCLGRDMGGGGAKRMGGGKRTRERALPKIFGPLQKSFWSTLSWIFVQGKQSTDTWGGWKTYRTRGGPKPLFGRGVICEVFHPPLFSTPPWHPLICALLRAFTCFCVRLRLERPPRLGTSDIEWKTGRKPKMGKIGPTKKRPTARHGEKCPKNDERTGSGSPLFYFSPFLGHSYFWPWAIFHFSVIFSHFWLPARFPFYTLRPDSQGKRRKSPQPKGPFGTKNAIAMEILVLLYCSSFLLAVPFAVILPGKKKHPNCYHGSELLAR